MNQRAVKVGRRRKSDWVLIIERYRASGLDREAFAAREGLKVGTLGWWAAHLRREDAVGKQKTPKAGPRSASFVPVRVVASTPRSSSATWEVSSEQGDARVELVLHGAVLRLDPERLSERGMVRLAALAKELCR